MDILSLDELARQDWPLQRTDARVKIFVVLSFITAVISFPKYEVSALLPFFLFPAAMSVFGMIPLWRVLTALLAAAPFAVLVGLANPFLDREPAAIGAGLIVARGWISFASIVVRFVLAVSAAFVLGASTGMHKLCGGLAALGMPQAMVVQLWMMYRYIFVLGGEIAGLARSVQVRSAGRAKLRPGLYARLAGNLLLRAIARAERIHQAMLARGFDGKMHILRATPLKARDICLAVVCLVFFVVARTWNLAEALGNVALTGIL